MSVCKLTGAFIRTVSCPPNRSKIDYFDTEQRGFLLEVRQSGGKTFYQRYRDPRGRERQFRLGPADVLTLPQARARARAVLANVVLGGDPQRARRDLRSIPTLSVFVRERYLPFVQGYKRSWQTDETVLRLHVLPALGSRCLDEIGPDEVAKLIGAMRARGYASGTCNRVLVLVKYVFNLARKWKVCPDLANPTQDLAAAPDVCRERFLSAEEAKRLLDAIEADENVVAGRAIKLLLLTGARRNEITQARWEQIEWDKRRLLVPVSKSGRPRHVALNLVALAVLRGCPRLPGNPFIFPSEKTGRPSPSLFFPWSRIRKRARLEGVRLHDLRHSFASFLVNRGVSLYVVQGLLGHTNAKTTQRYAHLAPATMMQAAELVGDIVIAPDAGTQRRSA